MSVAIIIIRCPHCGTMQLDQFSIMTAQLGGGYASSNHQSCGGCRRTISAADHLRSGRSIHITSGRGGVVAYVVELMTSIQDMVGDDASLDMSKLEYDKLPPILQLLYDIAIRYGMKPALLIPIIITFINWSKPFLLEQQSHLNESIRIEQSHSNKLDEITKQEEEARKTLELEYRLKRELLDHQHEIDSLGRKERELIDWLNSLPVIKAPEHDDTYQGALGRLQEFLNQFNQLNVRLKALELEFKRIENIQKASIEQAAGKARPIVEFPKRAKSTPKDK